MLREEIAPLRRSEAPLETEVGPSLFRRSWLPDRPERVLLIVHGYAEHSGRYEVMASWFARRGFAVHAYDQRGHGRTPGKRGHVDRFEHLIDDLAFVRATLAEEHRGMPLYLVGHSMGGLVVTSYLSEQKPHDVAAAAVSGALLELGPEISSARLTAARVLRRIAPRLSLSTGLDAEGLSRDPEVVRRYHEDPLVFDQLSAAFAAGMMDAIERLETRGAEIDRPLFLMHGAADPLCLPGGSERFFETLRTAGSDLRVYPELRHEIFNEPEREEIFRDLLEWLRAREGATG